MTLKVVEAREEHNAYIFRLARTDPILNIFMVYDLLNMRDSVAST